MTESYREQNGLLSAPMRRALAFQYLMEHSTITIEPDELIVGEKGPAPKATPTYPELCCHSLQDLDILDSREKIPFAVSAASARGVSRHDHSVLAGPHPCANCSFAEMTDEWKAAYEAGIFTEFMEQRAPGHTVLDDKIYHKGMLDFKRDIAAQPEPAGLPERSASVRQRARTAGDAHLRRCADPLRANDTPRRRANWRSKKAIRSASTNWSASPRSARTCPPTRRAISGKRCNITGSCIWASRPNSTRGMPSAPAISINICIRSISSGLADGTLTRDQAEELLQCFWIKFNNQPAPPKVGVTAAESGTYTDFAQINIGGVKADGSDAVNEVTYLLLDVIEEMRLLQPSSSVQVSKKNPDRFVKRAAKIIRTGFGQPSVFNTDLIVQELVRQGKSVIDARARRIERLRGSRRVRQRELQPDRLFQPAQDSGDHAAQRRSIRGRASRSDWQTGDSDAVPIV